MNSLYRRRLRLAGRTFVPLALAFAIVIAPAPCTPNAHAQENAAPAVRIRGGEEITDHSSAAMDQVGERDVKLQKPAQILGDAIAGFALGYLGYPYVWAGNSPAGFDCAGFAQWVILNVAGTDIGHALTGQPGAGAWIDYGTWQTGDLVFFQNTFQEGLSHVGIYLGDGLFVHAENEGTGVTISSIYSDYYGPRYWGSVRVE